MSDPEDFEYYEHQAQRSEKALAILMVAWIGMVVAALAYMWVMR